jgi:hypothetical protein
MEILFTVLIVIVALLTYVVLRGFRARGRIKRIRGQNEEIDTGM